MISDEEDILFEHEERIGDYVMAKMEKGDWAVLDLEGYELCSFDTEEKARRCCKDLTFVDKWMKKEREEEEGG